MIISDTAFLITNQNKVVKKNTLQDEKHILRLHGIYDVHIVDAKKDT